MQLKLSGPEAGVGARLDYTPRRRACVTAAWEIIESEPGKRVAYALTDIEPGKNKRTAFVLKKTGRAAATSRSPRPTTSTMAGT